MDMNNSEQHNFDKVSGFRDAEDLALRLLHEDHRQPVDLPEAPTKVRQQLAVKGDLSDSAGEEAAARAAAR